MFRDSNHRRYAIKRRSHILPSAAAAVAIAVPLSLAHAAVTISSDTTQNMTCTSGVCEPTSVKAVLNVGDLETMLASGNVSVTTTGAGVQAKDIRIDGALEWASANTLSFDAYESITINKPVSVGGKSGLALTTNDGGSGGIFAFGGKGQVTFASLSSALTINGAAYTLEGDIASLAAAIVANPSGAYALANDFDASGDGTYQNAPIPTDFSGNFEGLGNTISNLSINGTGDPNAYVGLFAELGSDGQPGGAIENVSLRKLQIGGSGFLVGGLVGANLGTISGTFVAGSAASNYHQGGPQIGLLAGISNGTITRSSAVGSIRSDQSGTFGGGLVGGSAGGGTIAQSDADSRVSGGSSSFLGGLTGQNGPTSQISQSYAIGKVSGGAGSDVGGLVGVNGGTIAQAYSTNALKRVGRSGHRGGLIGVDDASPGSITHTYWDTTTSRVTQLWKGAGQPKDDPGITGLTTTQLQSGLPDGFDPKVWAEDPNINDGLPYLIANPPPQ